MLDFRKVFLTIYWTETRDDKSSKSFSLTYIALVNSLSINGVTSKSVQHFPCNLRVKRTLRMASSISILRELLFLFFTYVTWLKIRSTITLELIMSQEHIEQVLCMVADHLTVCTVKS